MSVQIMKEFAVKHNLREYITDPVSQAAFLATATKESGLSPKRKNPKSSAYGYLQLVKATYHEALSKIMSWYSADAEPLRKRFRALGAINVDPKYHSEITRQKVLNDPVASMMIYDLLIRYYMSETKRVAGDVSIDWPETAIRVVNLWHHDWLATKNFLGKGSAAISNGVITGVGLDNVVKDLPGKPMRTDDIKMKKFASLALQAVSEYKLYTEG